MTSQKADLRMEQSITWGTYVLGSCKWWRAQQILRNALMGIAEALQTMS